MQWTGGPEPQALDKRASIHALVIRVAQQRLVLGVRCLSCAKES
jgi:hypothetical protein